MLISEEYRIQNELLHGQRADYGRGGHRWATHVTALAMELMEQTGEPPSILDYGCGKGTLKPLLPEFDVREYDPGIPEKMAKPEPADIVVCTDVLEHIEPEALGHVLLHLQNRAEKLLFFCISTLPSSKTLPDGRNAHLIVQPAGFWLTTLANHFVVQSFEITDKAFVGTATPLKLLSIPEPKMAVAQSARNMQAEVNCARVAARIVTDGDGRAALPCNGRRAHLLCGGPSTRDTWQEAVTDHNENGADIFTCSVSHKMAQEEGFLHRVKAHLDADPREHKALQIGECDTRVEYWLASCIHPTFIDKCDAAGATVKLWHAYNGQESLETLALKSERRQRMIMGGGSIGLRALSLIYYLGYHDIVIHGMDCSYGVDGADHAAEHLGKKYAPTDVYIGGRSFLTTPALITYARYFVKQMQWMPGTSVQLRGDGLLRHQWELSQKLAA